MKFTDAALDMMESQRWANPPLLQIELNAEAARLVLGKEQSELAGIYAHTRYNSERAILIHKLSWPRINKRLHEMKMAKGELVINAHDTAVSLALRAAENLNDFKDAAYADKLIVIPMIWDIPLS